MSFSKQTKLLTVALLLAALTAASSSLAVANQTLLPVLQQKLASLNAQRVSLSVEIEQVEQQKEQSLSQAQWEADGLNGCVPGRGARYKAFMTRAEMAEEQLVKLNVAFMKVEADIAEVENDIADETEEILE